MSPSLCVRTKLKLISHCADLLLSWQLYVLPRCTLRQIGPTLMDLSPPHQDLYISARGSISSTSTMRDLWFYGLMGHSSARYINALDQLDLLSRALHGQKTKVRALREYRPNGPRRNTYTRAKRASRAEGGHPLLPHCLPLARQGYRNDYSVVDISDGSISGFQFRYDIHQISRYRYDIDISIIDFDISIIRYITIWNKRIITKGKVEERKQYSLKMK